MVYMTSAEIREKYLSFFEKKGCKRWPSSSLIPDDPSLLLTSAGMVQFKPYFLQQKHLEEPYIGTTTVQKCVRTSDIDIIGTTGRHQSFFEMLGNFSFGGYFKREMCAWAYEFSTEVLGLPAERLYFTVFLDDDETIEIWRELGVPDDHLSRLGEEDNFWRAGPTGPCGPCSEIYYDQGPEFGCGSPDCAPGCDCDRFLEYWNLVFTQYDAQEDGTFKPLPKKNIDTGMGLERMASILQGVQSNYETDVLRSLIAVGEEKTGSVYGADRAVDLSLRIMADHSRAVAFMIADGILPSNEGRGYVLRRLLRRAVMKGHLLGLDKPFLNDYVDETVNLMGDVYPEIVENRELMRRVILSEEERFGANLRQGRTFLDEALSTLEGSVLPGDQAFILHDTYGFPVDVTRELCDERGIVVDMAGFERCMNQQKERARAANTKDAEAAWSTYGGVMSEILDATGPTEFVGYSRNEADARVLALVRDGHQVDALETGDEGYLVVDVTPFYAEKGGQVGDVGTMTSPGVTVSVTDTKEPEKGLVAHAVRVEGGRVAVGDALHAAIDVPRRERIRRNHTATHILHWALRQVLGDHVKQAGSYVAENRLRFDFTHFEALSHEQVVEIERLANEKIMENRRVHAYETSLASAREAGVIALFGEKYGEFVRVLDIEGFSQELCGGTHVSTTAEIGFVKITNETSVGANLRRIEAVTSYDALTYVNRVESELREAADELHAPLFDVSERTASTVRQLKELQGRLKRNRQTVAEDGISKLVEKSVDARGGYPLVVAYVGEADAGQLRNTWDIIRARLDRPGAAVLGAEKEGSPLLLAAGAPEAIDAGFDAAAVIKAISSNIGGGGGGKAAMAQAGGRDAAGLDAALEAARSLLL